MERFTRCLGRWEEHCSISWPTVAIHQRICRVSALPSRSALKTDLGKKSVIDALGSRWCAVKSGCRGDGPAWRLNRTPRAPSWLMPPTSRPCRNYAPSALRPRMHMRLPLVPQTIRIHRDQVELAMPHAGLRDHRLREVHYVLGLASQDHGLDAIVVIQVRVHRRDRHVVMIVLHLGKPAGELPLVMVVDVAQRRRHIDARRL